LLVAGADRQEELRQRIAALGFDEVRFAGAGDAPGAGLRAWLESGFQADMSWMERTADERLDPGRVLPGVRSVILMGVSYAGTPYPTTTTSGPIWARYALHRDYHETIKPGLVAAGKILEELYGLSGGDYRYYVDTGPVLERGWAARSGMGFLGKNTMLISRRHGNWLLLSALLTRAELAADPAGPRSLCGKCTRCMAACPTEAFAAPGVIDSRRCISYQTIENRGVIPRELRAGIGTRVFGCDICLDVCPWNRFARQGREMLIEARPDIAGLTWRDLLTLTPEAFSARFRHTPIHRLKLRGLLRNACIGAANSADSGLLPFLLPLARHADPIVRVHAVWAVHVLAGADQAADLLREARAAEADAEVLEEYAEAGAR
jgi:epoxyqueuosine reductase